MSPTAQSDVARMTRCVLKHPRDAYASQDAIDAQWESLHYSDRPDLAHAMREYDRFVELLAGFEVELEFLPAGNDVGLDSLYVRDASIVCGDGVILCNMGKPQRSAEPGMQGTAYRDMGVPVLGSISGDGRLEGGDVAWIDERTLAVGRGYRTNDEGIRQLGALLGDRIDELIVVPLPHYRGPNDVFHLMSVLSPIDDDLMLVYSPLLPVPFREALLARGLALVEVPDDEFETMACNVLAVARRRCVALAGSPVTRARLEKAGVEVLEYAGREISLKGAGGPTCLTRPLVRV